MNTTPSPDILYESNPMVIGWVNGVTIFLSCLLGAVMIGVLLYLFFGNNSGKGMMA